MVKALSNGRKISWDVKPDEVSQAHWADLYVGGLFFDLRDRCLSLLDLIESKIAQASEQKLSAVQAAAYLQVETGEIQKSAQLFLAQAHDPSEQTEASNFARECDSKDGVHLIRNLIVRDSHALVLRGTDIIPGAAFRGQAVSAEADVSHSEEQTAEVPNLEDLLPPRISYRIKNLVLLDKDIAGKLSTWLNRESEGVS
ncbi:MAG: hypothetical protein EOP06_18495 [Proteobacteria bacterium]|nr:MAG: hypothetical protein EOP06_18495 [Pseudomonadota bacterium]